MLRNSSAVSKKSKNIEKFIEEIFTDTMETESWVSAKENIIPSFK